MSVKRTHIERDSRHFVILLLVTAVSVCASCDKERSSAPGEGASAEQLSLRTRAIGVAGKRGVLVEGGTRKGPVWVPPPSAIEAFENAFPEQLGTDVDRGRKVDDYFRQYWGSFDDGRYVIDIEFFEAPPLGILEKPVIMFDGASSRASTRYFPDTGMLSGLEGGPPP